MHNIGPQHTFDSRVVAFADLNTDGHVDLLTGKYGDAAGFQVELGDGAGNWRLLSGPETRVKPLSIAVGDVNRDGRPEVLIGGDEENSGLQLWMLNANNVWQMLSAPMDSGIYREVNLADINGDGLLDIVAAGSDRGQGDGISVLLNDGQGGWFNSIAVGDGFFTDMSVIDLNGDGFMDIVASRRGGTGVIAETRKKFWRHVGGVQVWFGDGSGRWEPESLFADGDAEAVTVADVDGDGALEVVAGLYQQGIRFWRKRGKGWVVKNVVDEGTWGCLRVGDMDGDGRRELIATSSDGKGVRVWEWQGSFNPREGMLPDYGVYHMLDIADIRDVGALDVAVISDDRGVEVWSGLKPEAGPMREVQGELAAEYSGLFFDSGSAEISEESKEGLAGWLEQIRSENDSVQFTVSGSADERPVHSEIYPNNLALSRARAEAVASWMVEHGIDKHAIRIVAVGAVSSETTDAKALKQYRRVDVKAYGMRQVRLPERLISEAAPDLFHVEENTAFKTVGHVSEYKVGAGDEISMTFWRGATGEEHIVTVQTDGTVSLPYLESLEVAGLTPSEIDDKLIQMLARYERHPRVDVRVLKFISKTVKLFGEVRSLNRQPTGPGNYYLLGRETVADFLSRAGGPTKDADLSRVQLVRNGKTYPLNLDRAIKQGDVSENALLDDGDTIFILSFEQSKRQVYVIGAVGKPGIVEYNGEINFLEVVSKSGGLTEDAYLPDIRVVRADRSKPLILAVNFERFMEQGDLSQNLALQDKDILIVPSSPIANWNRFIAGIQPTISLLLQPVTIATQILTLEALARQVP